ncbi:putative DNA-binding domain-containing protein [Roseobacter sp.]|uniref:HvfC/BufC family peptide modification chaperone n=1 Tax=Roseobacter sp. TaxID=1907202 RepID=UPI00385D03BA
MNVSQSAFRGALLDADQDVPAGLLDARNKPAGSRYSVYRNNVVFSLMEALRTAFPLVYKLLGTQNFANLATVFVRDHPPRSPLMVFYGADMPNFLEGFEPLAHLGYLPDCARLDLAMRQSYHAADMDPIDPGFLNYGPENLLPLRLSLTPSTVLVRSVWPLFDIWQANFVDGAPKPRAIAQDVMIARPEFDPSPQLLVTGAADWFELLRQGVPFGEAHERMEKSMPKFDLAAALSQALQAGVLTKFKTKDS